MKPDNPYSYERVKIPQKRVERVLGEEVTIVQHLFKFRDSDNKSYVATLEEYPEKVYAFKFYAKAFKGKSQYNKLTGFNRPFRVLSTCIHILLNFYKESEPLVRLVRSFSSFERA